MKDMTGMKIGRFTVEKFDSIRKGNYYWICKCVCGTIKSVSSSYLTPAKNPSCGCRRREVARNVKAKDLTGQVFTRWTVLRRVPHNKHYAVWECKCVCGTVSRVIAASLRDGSSTSCGCKRREESSARAKKHGKYTTAEYLVWSSMKQRCLNKLHKQYNYYGARGIDIDPRWIKSFETFYLDVGSRPSTKHSLDRIDNNKGYWPWNVRWATKGQQARNRRNTVFLTNNGETCEKGEWARRYGVKEVTFNSWVRYHGQEEAFRRAEKLFKAREEHPNAFKSGHDSSTPPNAASP